MGSEMAPVSKYGKAPHGEGRRGLRDVAFYAVVGCLFLVIAVPVPLYPFPVCAFFLFFPCFSPVLDFFFASFPSDCASSRNVTVGNVIEG